MFEKKVLRRYLDAKDKKQPDRVCSRYEAFDLLESYAP
jgi:hypothetical protein